MKLSLYLLTGNDSLEKFEWEPLLLAFEYGRANRKAASASEPAPAAPPIPPPPPPAVKKLPHITSADLKTVERQLHELQRVLPECKEDEIKVVKKGRIAAPVMSAAKYVTIISQKPTFGCSKPSIVLYVILRFSHSHFDDPLFLNFTTCNLTSPINGNNGLDSV